MSVARLRAGHTDAVPSAAFPWAWLFSEGEGEYLESEGGVGGQTGQEIPRLRWPYPAFPRCARAPPVASNPMMQEPGEGEKVLVALVPLLDRAVASAA